MVNHVNRCSVFLFKTDTSRPRESNETFHPTFPFNEKQLSPSFLQPRKNQWNPRPRRQFSRRASRATMRLIDHNRPRRNGRRVRSNKTRHSTSRDPEEGKSRAAGHLGRSYMENSISGIADNTLVSRGYGWPFGLGQKGIPSVSRVNDAALELELEKQILRPLGTKETFGMNFHGLSNSFRRSWIVFFFYFFSIFWERQGIAIEK